MATIPTDRHALIVFVAWYASKLGRPVSRIRMVKFLYLGDVHFYAQRGASPRATDGSSTITARMPRKRSTTSMSVWISGSSAARCSRVLTEAATCPCIEADGPDPAIHERFSATLEAVLGSEIERWLGAELNTFLDYVYFETPSDARRTARRVSPVR